MSVLAQNMSQFHKFILHAYDKGSVKLLRVTFMIGFIREKFLWMEEYLWLERCYKTNINLRVFFFYREMSFTFLSNKNDGS